MGPKIAPDSVYILKLTGANPAIIRTRRHHPHQVPTVIASPDHPVTPTGVIA